MTFLKFIKCMILLTVLSVIYIHLQMQIVELAYKAKTKEERIHELKDHEGRLFFEITSLKSASHLGSLLLDQDKGLQFSDHTKIVILESPELKEPATLVAQEERRFNLLATIFSLRAQAEAKPLD